MNLDRLRLLAILMIVVHHCPGGGEVPAPLKIGLYSFVLITCTFRARRPFRLSDPGTIRRRAVRLLGAWLAASVLYGALRLQWVLAGMSSFEEAFEPTMLVFGTWVHLWFLPCLLCFELLVSLLVWALRRAPTGLRCLLWCALAAAALRLAVERFAVPLGAGAWLSVSACAPLGLLISEILRRPAGRHRPVAFVSAAAALVVLDVGGHLAGMDPILVRYSTVLGLILAGLAFTGRPDPVSRTLVPLNLGVYVLHPLVIGLLGLKLCAYAWPFPLLALAAWLASALLTRILHLTPLRAVT